jgi:peptidyl-prolyl cis-trans isomerase SurA
MTRAHSRRRWIGRTALALALGVSGLVQGPTARATVVERVVAVVGENPIFLTDMRQRARPFLVQIQQRGATGAQGAALESELYKQLLERMVEEQIEQQAADKAHLSVTSDEVDNALHNIANQQNITVDQLVQEAQKTGISAKEYRDEIRRQLLEGKLLQLRVRGRVRVTDEDVKALYTKIERTERHQLDYRVAWVVLRLPPGSSAADQTRIEQLARQITQTARAGHDAFGRPVTFASLANSFSDDSPTRSRGGDLGRRRPGDLAAEIEDQAASLAVGEVSEPFHFKDAIVVVSVTERDPSHIPPLSEARDELTQRAYGEQLEKARKQWIEEMKRGMYVDVRL